MSDVAMSGVAGSGDGSGFREYGDAGVTIWLESLSGIRASTDDLLAHVETGPPS